MKGDLSTKDTKKTYLNLILAFYFFDAKEKSAISWILKISEIEMPDKREHNEDNLRDE